MSALSLIPQQLPEQRMHTVTIDEVIALGAQIDERQPPLEHYFSPSRREAFIKDFVHYMNSSLLELKNYNLDLELYLVFAMSFQFISPLLEIPLERELVLFHRILDARYDVENLDINLHFSTAEHEPAEGSEDSEFTMINEEEALSAFRKELNESYTGRREVKEAVQKRLKQDGISAIKKWQQMKGLPELAEAFGRSIVIPSFFSYSDKKLTNFYRQNTRGIHYEVAVPDFDDNQ